MSFPRYPEYKDSGVAWLGNIPSAWKIQRVRFLFEIKKRIAESDDMDVLSITQNGIKIKDIESNDGQISSDYAKYQIVEIGDFAMNHMDLLTGYIDISKFTGVTSPDYRVFAIKNKNKCCDRYFLYLFQNGYRRKIFYAFDQGSSQFGRWRFPTDQFNDFAFPLPPLDEQIAVVEFLDRETAKIDALVVEQERLIELLKEKRQAVISHAVTKGLNPDASMKDSGIEWLGEVPIHWKAGSLKHFWDVIDCKHVTAEFVDEGVPLASIREVQGRFIELSAAKKTTDFFYELLIDDGRKPQPGDLIFSRNATVGEVAQVANWHPPFAMGQDVCLLRKQESTYCSNFLQTALQSKVVIEQLALCMIGSTFKRVNVEEIRNLVIPMPPPEEQSKISAFLGTETAKVDALITEAQRAIDLLKERRAALISATVTGQIDVRGLVADNHAPAERVPA